MSCFFVDFHTEEGLTYALRYKFTKGTSGYFNPVNGDAEPPSGAEVEIVEIDIRPPKDSDLPFLTVDLEYFTDAQIELFEEYAYENHSDIPGGY